LSIKGISSAALPSPGEEGYIVPLLSKPFTYFIYGTFSPSCPWIHGIAVGQPENFHLDTLLVLLRRRPDIKANVLSEIKGKQRILL